MTYDELMPPDGMECDICKTKAWFDQLYTRIDSTHICYQCLHLEEDIREKIAQEIESEGPWCGNHNNPGQPNDCPCYVFAAKIARGK